ncbi:hypothetical protein Tco_0597040 [Tanacetum coccineum]
MKLFKIGTSRRKSLDKENVSKQGRNLKTRSMFEEGDFDDDFNDIDDMVNEAMENVEGDTVNAGGAVNTANTRVSVPSASVTTAGVSISTAEPRTPPTTTTTAFEDEDLTIAQTLVKMRSQKDKEKGVAFRDIAQRLFEEEQAQFEREQRIARERAAEQEAKDAALIEQMEDVQARMDADVLLVERLQQEEREQFTIEEKSRMLVEMIAERKRFFAAQRAAKQRSKPPTKAQMRNKMCTYLKNQAGYNHNQLKGRSYDEIQKLFDKAYKHVNSFIPMDSKVIKDSGKKDDSSSKQAGSRKKRAGSKLKPKSPKKLKVMKEQESAVDDAEKEELRACLDIVPGDDIAINVESLTTKYPIVDWKTHILTENMMYYQIIRADGSSKNYKIFSEMLDDFDRQDVVDLYSLVKERYEIISPEGYDRLLWGDLITLFESSEEDEIWKGQQDYKLISWRLFDSCGVHVLLMDTGVAIHMMVEKKYPLTQEMLSRMLNRRLEVDHESTMAFELIRFIKAQHIHQGTARRVKK